MVIPQWEWGWKLRGSKDLCPLALPDLLPHEESLEPLTNTGMRERGRCKTEPRRSYFWPLGVGVRALHVLLPLGFWSQAPAVSWAPSPQRASLGVLHPAGNHPLTVLEGRRRSVSLAKARCLQGHVLFLLLGHAPSMGSREGSSRRGRYVW